MTPTPREALIEAMNGWVDPTIETSTAEVVDALDAHLDSRGYLVAAPSMGKIDTVAVQDAALARESARHREAAEAVLEGRDCGCISWDDGSRWELGDTTAGGGHPDSRTINGQMVPGFITLRIVSPDGREQQYRYNYDPANTHPAGSPTPPKPSAEPSPAPVGGTEEAMPGTVGGMIEEIRALRSAPRSRSTGGAGREYVVLQSKNGVPMTVLPITTGHRHIADEWAAQRNSSAIEGFAYTVCALVPLDSLPAVPEESKP